LPILDLKKVGIVANQTSVLFHGKNKSFNLTPPYTHLVDSLQTLGVEIIKVFAPEHGFRGNADAGESIRDGVDVKTKLPIISIYGKNKKPSKEQLKNIDIMLFDIQDVGARFYTYISTLHYIMEACAESNIPLIVLDRPNPNGHYIDGPVLEKAHKSFVGIHPIPIVHGMTIAEYAQMINGENWLDNSVKCELILIDMENYNHEIPYSLPIKPSPNLPNDVAVNLYPSLCFFEGTNVSVGRGTPKQFQIYGSPYLDNKTYNFEFIPEPSEGATYPKHDGELCYGENLSNSETLSEIQLSYLIRAYKNTLDKDKFFNDFFTNLSGTKKLREQIENGVSERDIKMSWKQGLIEFRKTRQKYLIYD